MKLQEIFAQQKYNTMKLRARSMSTKPQNILEQQVNYLTQLVMTVTKQRDGLSEELLRHRAILERQTARIVELQEHIENFDGEDR